MRNPRFHTRPVRRSYPRRSVNPASVATGPICPKCHARRMIEFLGGMKICSDPECQFTIPGPS